MNYELAKELKDAGFPQKHETARGMSIGFPGTVLTDSLTYEDAYAPTLSELIVACGERFGVLHTWEGGWLAGTPENHSLGAKGATPEEAVARLFLALNPKK